MHFSLFLDYFDAQHKAKTFPETLFFLTKPFFNNSLDFYNVTGSRYFLTF